MWHNVYGTIKTVQLSNGTSEILYFKTRFNTQKLTLYTLSV